ncbi:MAG: Rid family detoxifying hydrolase [Chitinispirillaceae bacterium]|jgi:2-iminobutanoate/2-iminopropanoate deaminase
MPHRTIATPSAPQPVGPYSQAVTAGKFVFISGQILLDPDSGVCNVGAIGDQTRQTLRNLKAVLSAANLSPHALVKTTVYLRSMADFAAFNAVYEEELAGAKPARSVVEVNALPRGALVEIEAIACR